MATIPNRVYERLVSGLKRYQPILNAAKSRDAAEADTSTIVKDILSEMFGYDKYTEITAEYMIKCTYCDLAIKMEGKPAPQLLIEVKAIGVELKDAQMKQAVDYAANLGVNWVILTNGAIWRVFNISFGQAISQELVIEYDLLSLNPRNRSQVESLFLLTREGQPKSVLDEHRIKRQAMSRHYLGALILHDVVVDVVRRELRRLSPDVKIDKDELRAVLVEEVLKREVTEGDKADEARKRVAKAQATPLRIKAKVEGASSVSEQEGEASQAGAAAGS